MASTSFPIVVNAASPNLVFPVDASVDKIRWVGASGAGHVVEVHDRNGNLKFGSVAPGGNYVESETFTSPIDFDGIVVPVLTSGVLYIYILNK